MRSTHIPLNYLFYNTVDVDPSLWGFKGKESYERRDYFWNLVAGVLWQVR